MPPVQALWKRGHAGKMEIQYHGATKQKSQAAQQFRPFHTVERTFLNGDLSGVSA